MKNFVVINTQVNAQGEYEGVSIEASKFDTTDNDAGHSQATQQTDKGAKNEQVQHDSGKQGARYQIDINDLNGKPPPWVLYANHIFNQSVAANVEGVYSDYMRQVQAQFDQMYMQLQQQMRSYTQAGSKK